MVAEELRQLEEEERQAVAVGQAQQGAWTKWEEAEQRKVSWQELWRMEPIRIKFLIKAVYDLLPSPTNLVRWGVAEDSRCGHCQERGSLEHVLSACKESLTMGMYTYRHNQVLKVLRDAVQPLMQQAKRKSADKKAINFVKEGEMSKAKKKETNCLLHAGWTMSVDIEGGFSFPHHIAVTRQRPDMVLWCDDEKKVLLVELTVPWEGNMEWAHERKLARYVELEKDCRARGWSARTYAVEVGCRGFVGRSVGRFC